MLVAALQQFAPVCLGELAAIREIINQILSFITVDTLRPDFLGCYGHRKNTSPNIDHFAEDSVLFENCFAHGPETHISFASIFTGFYPHETIDMAKSFLPSGNETIAEMLQKQGYNTAAVVSNYVLRKGYGWNEGFTIYDDTIIRSWGRNGRA